jgi:glycosyltransferase involved in cell wall biosynthesis
MPDFIGLPPVSIVVIGFNEAKNLDKTFRAINSMNYPQDLIEMIYVDSGSSDDSLTVAMKYTDKVHIEARFPSSGRNRNRGLVEAKHDIVHFIDGDVVIDPDYLKNIAPLFAEKNVQAIVGQLDEQYPNIYNRMAALSNVEKKEGYANFTSTGATYLRRYLLAVNGYDERIRRGQEAELGERFREAGNKIWCTSHKMGSHNFAVNNLMQYIKKYEINGKSLLQVSLITGESSYIKSAKLKIRKQKVKFFMFIASIALSLLFKSLVFLLGFLMITWLLRVRGLFAKKWKQDPMLVILRSLIDFFFFWKWWVGFFKELKNYHFDKRSKEFYQLTKMQLPSN